VQLQFSHSIIRRAVLVVAMAFGVHLAKAANIVVGQVAPLTGMEATQGRAYAEGMKLFFDQVNKAGGAGGNTFSLVTKDDAGVPANTVSATASLLAESKPLVLAGYIGNKNITDLIASGVLQKEKIPLVGYRSSEMLPATPMLYAVSAGVREQVERIALHLSTIGITKLALLYEDGPSAPGLVAATKEAAKKANAQLIAEVSYPAGTTKVSAAVDSFQKASPQAIILLTSGSAAAAFIEQYRTSGGTAQIFAHTGADVEQMSKRLSEEHLKGVAIAQVTPNPYKISSRLAKELNELAAKSGNAGASVSYAMMEGFIAAKVIVEAARRQGHGATREGFVAALDSLDNVDLGGYVVKFKGQHTGSRYVELTIINGEGHIRQ
jgi:ABC-type branched-subunit amino acid transport system substrate-binding protein